MAVRGLLARLADDALTAEDCAPLCGQLRWLSLPAENRQVVVAAGAVGVLVKVLRRFLEEAEIQCLALEVLTHLAACEEGGRALLSAEAQALPAVVATFRAHPKHSAVQEGACALVRQLALVADSHGPLVDAGMVGYLLAAMQLIGSPKVLAECCAAIGALARADPDLRHDFVHDGCVLNFVLRALRQAYSASTVVVAACGAVAELAVVAGGWEKMAEGEAVDHCLLAMETHQYNPDVLRSACLALQPLLAHCPEEHYDCCVVLLRMLKRHSDLDDPPLLHALTACLADLMEADSPGRLRSLAVRAGAHAAVGRVLQDADMDEATEAAAQRFLRSLAMNKWEPPAPAIPRPAPQPLAIAPTPPAPG
eukprot:EG_transcript_14433